MADYLACILFRLLGPIIRFLPLAVSFFLGRRLGDLFYYFDLKHRALAYNNIRTAFSEKPPQQIEHITKEFYRAFGQNFIEIFLIPLVDKRYTDKYVTLEGIENIREGFLKKRGMLLVSVHAGDWEFTNIISANTGVPYNLFVREQKFPRLNNLLNVYRRQKGCKVIQRENQTRRLIEALRDNEGIGMSLDQGGASGLVVKFFGKAASMASGAVRIALKYNTLILPVFITRVRGPYLKVLIDPAFEVSKTDDPQKDMKENLQKLVRIFERRIERYPQEYLWSYKVWKYSNERRILILSDAKAGHLRQSQALAGIVKNYFANKAITTEVEIIEPGFKNRFSRLILSAAVYLSGRYSYRIYLWCVKNFLSRDTYDMLMKLKPDIVISAGSSLAALNVLLSRYNLCRSITAMRPSFLPTHDFDLVVMPRHDRPPRKKNIVITEGALNLSDRHGSLADAAGNSIGLLIGGDAKNFTLSAQDIKEVSVQVKAAAQKLNMDILVTTSRRTSAEIESVVKQEFTDYPACRLLIIANEKNTPEAVGMIFQASRIIVVSPESISMVSEAAASGRYAVVFDAPGLGIKHRRFLENLCVKKYIYLSAPDGLNRAIENIWLSKPEINVLNDNLAVAEAIRKIL